MSIKAEEGESDDKAAQGIADAGEWRDYWKREISKVLGSRNYEMEDSGHPQRADSKSAIEPWTILAVTGVDILALHFS